MHYKKTAYDRRVFSGGQSAANPACPLIVRRLDLRTALCAILTALLTLTVLRTLTGLCTLVRLCKQFFQLLQQFLKAFFTSGTAATLPTLGTLRLLLLNFTL